MRDKINQSADVGVMTTKDYCREEVQCERTELNCTDTKQEDKCALLFCILETDIRFNSKNIFPPETE